MPTPEEIAGREIRRLRAARGWSQEELAERMKAYGYEWHQTLIGRIEAAQRPLRLNEAVDMCRLFGVPVDRLMWPDPDLTREEVVERLDRARMELQEVTLRLAEAEGDAVATEVVLRSAEQEATEARMRVGRAQAERARCQETLHALTAQLETGRRPG